jgi:hypothetical protein
MAKRGSTAPHPYVTFFKKPRKNRDGSLSILTMVRVTRSIYNRHRQRRSGFATNAATTYSTSIKTALGPEQWEMRKPSMKGAKR